MVDLRISEVSGVDRAANLAEGWLMLKSAALPEDVALTLAKAEAAAQGIDPDTITKGNDMPALTDEVRSELPEDAQTYIKSLEDAVIAAADATKATDEPAETEEDRVAKALAALPDEVRTIVEKAQRESASANKVLKEMADREAEAKFTLVAKSLTELPDTTTPSLAKALREVAESAPTAYEPILKTLRAANAAVEKSPLFKELGSGGDADANSEDPTTVMAAKANEIISKAKPEDNMTFAKAMTRAANENPDIYRQHVAATKQ